MKNRTSLVLTFVCLFLAACAPAIVVENATSIPVRVVVSTGGASQVVSPSPGESSSLDAGDGAWSAAAIPDQEWRDYAVAKRQYLNDRLANSDQLTGPQLLEVVNQLKDIALKMKQYDDAAKAGGASCSGFIDPNNGPGDGTVTVSLGSGSQLLVTCK